MEAEAIRLIQEHARKLPSGTVNTPPVGARCCDRLLFGPTATKRGPYQGDSIREALLSEVK